MPNALITSNVAHYHPKGLSFIRKTEACYDKRLLSNDEAQCLNESPFFFKGLESLIERYKRLRFIKAFDIVVPQDYEQGSRLSTFRKTCGKDLFSFNRYITDESYARATTKPTPGQRLRCNVVRIIGTTTSADCLDFLKSQRALLLGAQGASLAYEFGKNKLPSHHLCVSFDEVDALYREAPNVHLLPYLFDCGGGFSFDYCRAEFDLQDISLVYFCDPEDD